MLKFEEQQMLCFDWNDWYTGMFLYMLTVTVKLLRLQINAMEVNTTDNFTEQDVDMQKLQESVRLPSQKVKVTW